MPDNTYFRQPDTQKMLLDILFIFCKLNPDVGYRQGMHEVLAPILWVVERDAVDPKEAGVDNRTQHKDLLLDMCNSHFIEHDTFTLFGLVMQNAKAYYEPSKTKQSDDSPMLVKCRHIFDKLLPKADPELADHLKEIEVAPQMFLMYVLLPLILTGELTFEGAGCGYFSVASSPSMMSSQCGISSLLPTPPWRSWTMCV